MLCCIALFYAFSSASKEYKQDQDIYFSKVSYHIEGKIIDYDYLGGGNCLLQIKVDSSYFNDIKLKSEDDFIGLYDDESKMAFMLDIFDPPVDFENNKLQPHELPYLKANSSTREVIYSGGVYNDTVPLRVSDVYQMYLKRKERQLKKSFRF